MRYVAIGDIHGYLDKLNDLIVKLETFPNVDFERDIFVFLGDYIDGGPDSADVVECLRWLQASFPHWVFLKGNHEDLMLDVLLRDNMTYGDDRVWLMQGGKATYDSYLKYMLYRDEVQKALVTPKDAVFPAHATWLNNLPTIYSTENYHFVHAGLWPDRDVEKTSAYDRMWLRGAFINSDFDWGKRVIFGHTYQKSPLILPNKIGIDTMHHGAGKITAAILDDRHPRDVQFVYSKE